MSGDIFWLLEWGKVYYWHLVGEDQGCCFAPHNPVHPTKNYLISKVNSTKVEKPCSRRTAFVKVGNGSWPDLLGYSSLG